MISRKLKIFDFVTLAICTSFVAVSFIALQKNKAVNGRNLLIINAESGGKKDTYIYPLKENGLYKIQGTLGISLIQIEGEKAFFVDSPCPNKTCISSAKISQEGQWAACLPNRVFIKIEKEGKKTFDGIAE